LRAGRRTDHDFFAFVYDFMRGGEEPPPDSDTWRRTCDEPVSIDPLRAMTAAEALELVGPVGLDEVYEKGSFSVA